jgi:hypothetical protein
VVRRCSSLCQSQSRRGCQPAGAARWFSNTAEGVAIFVVSRGRQYTHNQCVYTESQGGHHSSSTPARGPPRPPTPRPSPQVQSPPNQSQGQVSIAEQNFSNTRSLMMFLLLVLNSATSTPQWICQPRCGEYRAQKVIWRKASFCF